MAGNGTEELMGYITFGKSVKERIKITEEGGYGSGYYGVQFDLDFGSDPDDSDMGHIRISGMRMLDLSEEYNGRKWSGLMDEDDLMDAYMSVRQELASQVRLIDEGWNVLLRSRSDGWNKYLTDVTNKWYTDKADLGDGWQIVTGREDGTNMAALLHGETVVFKAPTDVDPIWQRADKYCGHLAGAVSIDHILTRARISSGIRAMDRYLTGCGGLSLSRENSRNRPHEDPAMKVLQDIGSRSHPHTDALMRSVEKDSVAGDMGPEMQGMA